MSTGGGGWWYMQKHWTGEKSVGPVSDMMLLDMAHDGKLEAKTAVMHPTHTSGTWVFLEQVPLAKKQLDRRAEELKEAADLEKKQKDEQWESKWQEGQRLQADSQTISPIATTPTTKPPVAPSPVVTRTDQPQFHQPMSPQFRCPFCQSTSPPYVHHKVSAGGWVTLVVMLLLCFPLFWIGLLITENYHTCSTCGVKLG